MDQLKEILKQAIKYRFWIAVGVSALLPLIAYFAGVGPIQEKARAEEGAINAAYKDVQQYASGTLPNAQYKQIVSEKTDELSKDVEESWKKLYTRQAPLLTWPDRVHERFTAWGRKWPDNTDASAVQIAIIDYVNVYPAFVTEVYKSFRPFNPEDGEGVVSSPPEEMLLRPAKFTEQEPPSLGKVWAAQERLWIQRTLLDVVANVNKDAKNWDTAIIKQVNALEVGNQVAQDQRSIAKGETLEPAPDINDPNKPAAPPPTTGGTGMPGSEAAGGTRDLGMPGYPGYNTPGGPLGGLANTGEGVFYIHTDSQAFKVLPVELSVLIDQDHIQDLLVGLENSPMTIQVKDFELARPSSRVVKPEKGTAMGYYGYGGMMPGMDMLMPGMREMSGFGGRMVEMPGMYDAAMPGMGGGGAVLPARKGVDTRSQDARKKFKEAVKTAKSVTAPSLHDPYYNIVEVKVYGQARFFSPPPAPAPAEPSQAAPADAAAATPAEGEKKAEEAKAEEKKAEEPKAEEKKAEEPKAEEKKAEEPKAEEKKAEEPKAAR
jgi:hypothetical protein